MTPRVDLNCDLGESFGAWTMGNDAQIIPLLSSINIACGFHAGDPQTMLHTVRLAKAHGVAVGAHPSLPDLRGFGRRELRISADELYADTLYQLGALQLLAHSEGMPLQHVKAHGALYHMLEKQPALADAFLAACKRMPNVGIVGLSGGSLLARAEQAGFPVAHEFFADRRYRSDGGLVARDQANALITDTDEALAQCEHALKHGAVNSVEGTRVAVRVDSICLHGDGAHALEFAHALRARLDTFATVQSAF
jgi:5-oxoprolinase (ATP-hydrolysing) subunit A